MKKLPNISLDSLRIPAGMQQVTGVLKNGSHKVSAISAVAGAAIDAISATRDERGYLSEIADEYRPEIAERLGLAENQVTQQHYQMAFEENPVLAQAKDVSKMSGIVRAANSAIAVGTGVLAGLVASSLSRPKQIPGVDNKGKDPANIAGGVAATLAAAAAGKVARKVMHTSRLEGAMERTAHHKIMQIKEKQQRGEETTAADIFVVQLALNPEVDKTIAKANGNKHFADMKPEQQMELLRTEFSEILAANNEMADHINHDGMRPQALVFGEIRAAKKPIEPLAPGHPDLPPNAALPVEPKAVEASGAEEAVQQTLREQQQPHVVPQSERPLDQPQQPSHVERFAPERAQEEGFASRVESARNQQAEAAMQR